MKRQRLHTSSVLVIATFALSAMALGAGLLLKRTVLVIDDDSCNEIKGEITGHRNVKYQDPNTGAWTDYTMTACRITVAEKARVSPPSVSTNLAGLSETTTFSKVVETAGMADTLDKEKEVTVFAPSNAAMKKMSPRLMDELMSDRKAAREFVLRHCVLGKRFAFDGAMIKNTAKLGDAMTGGDRMVRRVTFQSNRPHVAESSIVIADLDTDNSVIHVIDSILRDKYDPPTVGAGQVQVIEAASDCLYSSQQTTKSWRPHTPEFLSSQSCNGSRSKLGCLPLDAHISRVKHYGFCRVAASFSMRLRIADGLR